MNAAVAERTAAQATEPKKPECDGCGKRAELSPTSGHFSTGDMAISGHAQLCAECFDGLVETMRAAGFEVSVRQKTSGGFGNA